MKYFVVFCLVVSFAVTVYCAPADLGEDELLEQNLGRVRVKRVTCDVLSVEAKGVKLNDAACALHCLYLRRTGGYCNSRRVCVCR